MGYWPNCRLFTTRENTRYSPARRTSLASGPTNTTNKDLGRFCPNTPAFDASLMNGYRTK